MSQTVKCSKCEQETDTLAVFPGGLCLDCYGKTSDATHAYTADEIVEMWGGPVRHRR